MRRPGFLRRRPFLIALPAAVILGCQERLTSPAECPELCPGGGAEVFDLVLQPLPGADSSYRGFVTASSAVTILASTGPELGEHRVIYRFVPRPDSITVRDTARAYTVDSVLLSINLIARDTLTDGLSILVYRLPHTVDDNTTFAEVDPLLTDANLIDVIPLPDSVNSGRVQTLLQGEELSRIVLPDEADGTLALGVTLTAAQPTGVRLGATGGGSGASFVTYTTVDVPDTAVAIRQQSITRPTAFSSYVGQTALAIDTTLLTVGGVPSSRALLRFDLPESIEDSATIVRATLELIPQGPIHGLATDPSRLEAKAVLADLGVKSPVTQDERFVALDTIPPGLADTVRLDVTRIVQLWQSTSVERPEAIFVSLAPEAGSFMRAEFGSTRRPDVGAPRLRVTYLRSFPFESP